MPISCQPPLTVTGRHASEARAIACQSSGLFIDKKHTIHHIPASAHSPQSSGAVQETVDLASFVSAKLTRFLTENELAAGIQDFPALHYVPHHSVATTKIDPHHRHGSSANLRSVYALLALN